MKRDPLPKDSNELWNLTETIVKHSPLFQDWGEVADNLRYINKKPRRAFYAKRRRRTTDWNFLASILVVLGCRMYVVIPETKEEAESTQKVVANKEAMSLWNNLTKDDKQIVLDLMKRLNK